MKTFKEYATISEKNDLPDLTDKLEIEVQEVKDILKKIIVKGKKNDVAITAKDMLKNIENIIAMVPDIQMEAEHLTESELNEHVDVEKLYNALQGKDSEEFIDKMYDWFQDEYPEASLYAGDDTPDDFIEYLEHKGGKKLRDFYIYMKKGGLIK